MRFGLDRMHRLMTVLGLPQRALRLDPRGRLNGKSSTVRFTAAILERHGLRTAATPRRTCARSASASRWGRSRSPERGLRRGRRARRARRRAREPHRRARRPRHPVRGAHRRRLPRAGAPRGGGGRDRGRPRRPLRRHQRDPVAGAGAHLGEPRAHPLARPDARRHRRGEARRGARPRHAGGRATSTRSRWPSPERVASERHARLVTRAGAIPDRAAAGRGRLPARATSPSPRPRPRPSSAARSTRMRSRAPRRRRSSPAAWRSWPSAR